MKNAPAAAVAALALLSNVACTSLAPASATTLVPGARVRLSAPSGLLLIGGTPNAPEPLLTCAVRSLEARVTRVSGDSVVVTNIGRRDLAPGGHPRCVMVVRGVVVAQPDAQVAVEQRKLNSRKTAVVVFATVLIVGSMAYALSNAPLVATP